MTIRIVINTDNEAFQDNKLGPEVARILKRLASEINGSLPEYNIRDTNGNKVGTFDIDEE